VSDLLAGSSDTIAAQLTPFADALVHAATPRHVLSWLRRADAAQLIMWLAQGGDPVSHDLLDGVPGSMTSGAVDYLRQLLVLTGVLAARFEPLARLEPWLDALLTDRPRHHDRLVRPFAQWVVIRRARRDHARGRYTHSSANADRTQIRIATRLLDWLDHQGLSVGELTQAHLDEWIAEGSKSHKGQIRAFLGWTAARGLSQDLVVARQRDDTPSRFLAEDHHLELLRRCLTGDPHLPLDVRVAAALVLLYGVRFPKMLRLTAHQLIKTDTGTYLTIDAHPVLLPPNLAQALEQLAAQPARNFSLASGGLGVAPYLFPGRPPSRPCSPAALSARLRRYGIYASAARNTALIKLAAELPAPVIAKLFGLHPRTAAAWSSYAQADWAAYLAARPSP
jgi:hypothetical protein